MPAGVIQKKRVMLSNSLERTLPHSIWPSE